MFKLSLCHLLLLPLVCSQLPRWVNSPDYPLGYPSHVSMNWTECVPAGFSVSLTLVHLDLENSTLCNHDVLKIFTDQNLKKTLCGSMSFDELQSSVNPHLFTTSGGCLSIYFHSDDSHPQAHTGFTALYQKQDIDECASQNNPCSHFCYNFIGGFRCSCPHGYVLNPNNHTCDAINCGEPKPLLNGHVQFVKGSNNEYLSVIKYRCNEPFYTSHEITNASYTCGADQKWKKNVTSSTPSCHSVCGYHKPPSEYGRIFGGKEAPPGSFPWQILLYSFGKRAGAFIIGGKWIMTAAHNFKSNATLAQNVKAYAGHNKRNERNKFITLNISSVHIHPHYKFNHTDYDNDIALIKLHTSITFNAKVRPVCLPPKGAKMEQVNSGLVSGFGLKDGYSDSDELHYVRLPIVDHKTCRQSYEHVRGKNSNPQVTDNMFCAGFEYGEKDACQGDSGSAFVAGKGGVLWAMGIVSWGEGCGMAGLYGVYTRISQYLEWINKTMSEN